MAWFRHPDGIIPGDHPRHVKGRSDDMGSDVYYGDFPHISGIFHSGDNRASYDFSDNLRKFQWGAQIGTEWKAFKHLIVYADLTWGLNDIFQKDFDTITFGMYPIYLNVGFGYAF